MPTMARSKSASATKSRSLTASRELANTSPEPERGGGEAGSIGSDVPASAPAPSGDTSRRSTRRHEAVDVAGERPPVGQEVVRQQHRLGPLEVGVTGEVGVAGGLGAGEEHVLRGRRRARPSRSAPACTTAAGRWRPGRCGCVPCAAWRRPCPASSVTRRSTAVWMSSSVWANAKRSADSSSSTWSSAARIAAASSVGEQPGPGQPADVRPRAGDVVAPESAVERQADRVGEQCVGGTAGEAAVPERLRHRRRRARRAGAGGRPGRSPWRSRRRRTGACRRRRPCRSARRARCGRAPRPRRGRIPAACAG